MRNPTDEEVMQAIRSVPRHFSAHRLRQDISIAPWVIPDPGILNTTAGAGILQGYSLISCFNLQSTHATTGEIRTLPDPLVGFLQLGLVLTVRTAQNLVVRCNTPVFIGTTVTQPAITQLGQYITFSAINQVAILTSAPSAKSSYVGTQSTITNATGFRWVIDVLDGATVT